MLKFNVKLNGIEKGKADTLLRSRRVLQKSMFKMEELAIKKAPFDRGYLSQNITVFPHILSNKYILTSRAPYSADLEFGNTPRHVDFKDIEEWVRRKGIRSKGNEAAFVNYVVEKIRTRGVNAHPFMRPALQQTKDFWLPQFEKEEFAEF